MLPYEETESSFGQNYAYEGFAEGEVRKDVLLKSAP